MEYFHTVYLLILKTETVLSPQQEANYKVVILAPFNETQ